MSQQLAASSKTLSSLRMEHHKPAMWKFSWLCLVGLFLLPSAVGATEIIAHRGASGYEPENTLRAVQRAWEMGADATEIDVYLTKDDQIVVLHDSKLDRTTSGVGPVKDFTLAELQELKIRWKDELLEDETIPSLEQVLAIIPEGKRIFIEIKTGPEIVPALKRILDACTLKDEQLVVITFNESTLKESKKVLPDLKHYYLSDGKKETIDEVIAKTKAANADGINLSTKFPITAELVQQAKEAGYDTYVWTLRDKDSELVPQLVEMGVVGLTTDFPDLCRDWLPTE
ncbi:glycerophosphodiester phosphodiesterase [Thalassoglobus sp.]|uniref:glycerophosphodiester phosphodiesterase n=1 Tax=Thalassoglobus sp. TaxID=2795869 RepID=UPI003AA940C1